MQLKALLAIPVLFLWACKQPTPAEQLDSALSWLATAGMAGDAWLRHTTPDRYTRETLELSRKTLEQIRGDLLKAPPSKVDAASLDGALTRSRRRIAQMAKLVEAKDSPAFATQLDSLRSDEKIVKQLDDSANAGQ
ncbi:MAG TPA: hypothetical protein VGG76_08915 [Gemmatimonadaceae bacterium]|jgi:hypothetical protein